MNNFCKGIILTALLNISPMMVGATAIQEVAINLQSATSALPPFLHKRMEAGIYTVGEHVFLNKDTVEIQNQRQEYENITSDILSRVLYGYDVQSIDLDLGAKTTLNIVVKPYKDIIENIEMDIDYGNLSPMAQSLLQDDIAKIKPQLEQILLGASLDAFDWINSIVEKILRERLSDDLPEFTTKVSIELGKTTKVKVFVIPQGEMVRKVNVDIKSKSLPKLVFLPMQNHYQNKYEELTGLPIAYLKRKVSAVENLLKEELQNSKASKVYDVSFTPHLRPEVDTNITINAALERYLLTGGVAIDMGKEKNNVSLQTHLGYYRTPKQEIYIESEFYPGNYQWKIYPSLSYEFSKDTSLAYQYEMKERQSIALFKQSLGDGTYLRMKKYLNNDQYQYALVYKLDNHLNIEYIVEKEENWLRLVGNI